IGGLRDKLNRSNLTNVSFMIVNEREAQSRAMYWELKRRAPPGVPVYQQAPLQSDVWEALDGDKDDFLVYDRCGLLTFHIVLPYSFLHYPYVEAAIRATYHKNICKCNVSHTQDTLSSGNSTMKNETTRLHVNQTTAIPTDDPEVADTAAHHHSHHHPHHSHHHHRHTSDQIQSQHQQNSTENLSPPSHHQPHPHPHQHQLGRHSHHGGDKRTDSWLLVHSSVPISCIFLCYLLIIWMARVCWWFYFSKVIELSDTVFFTLWKKNSQLTFLHVYHHATMIFNWWAGVKYVAGGQCEYTSARSLKNAKKHCLALSLSSLLSARLSPVLHRDCTPPTPVCYHLFADCDFPDSMNMVVLAYSLSLIALFSNFYYQSYIAKKTGKKA
ncbi:hypothetical protein L3Q82_021811, partial [Scortum barcoo]